jgi:hypothetical protein
VGEGSIISDKSKKKAKKKKRKEKKQVAGPAPVNPYALPSHP